jgi:hypothetical protein
VFARGAQARHLSVRKNGNRLHGNCARQCGGRTAPARVHLFSRSNGEGITMSTAISSHRGNSVIAPWVGISAMKFAPTLPSYSIISSWASYPRTRRSQSLTTKSTKGSGCSPPKGSRSAVELCTQRNHTRAMKTENLSSPLSYALERSMKFDLWCKLKRLRGINDWAGHGILEFVENSLKDTRQLAGAQIGGAVVEFEPHKRNEGRPGRRRSANE